ELLPFGLNFFMIIKAHHLPHFNNKLTPLYHEKIRIAKRFQPVSWQIYERFHLSNLNLVG
ncbi:hypothetical protein, partial [Streptococcus danieliae]|uniref:hypothetical protein n=1 Tax=Streptococcus danieliae TaxID=747656 RepID=UPI0026E96198